ncbi:ubiquitin carboxyl-terminal hydrolase family [Micractinium conductrix]|uniref:Ubiquitin carboxyl-terminal hydrolase family n=1 Tax=Micractinium conductrix TaxID=554055 RepID=A0A2P6VA61_9CHLO|nr:ubiquitin carboxyl-terminal hydrolase family [Micractinium conductrix]|eukprot:PSC70982.1 ubiquitin carboxyl-terminal hydrolase family [Micractinium conductrix]
MLKALKKGFKKRLGSSGLPPDAALPEPPPAVDYELVAGPLELDGAAAEEELPAAAALAAAEAAGAAAELDGAASALGYDPHEQQQVCYGSAGTSGGPSAEEAAAAAAVLVGQHDGSGPSGGAPNGGPTRGSEAGSEAGGEAAAEAPATESEISDTLATMMYLTEDAEGADDCVSVVSDALSEEDLPDDISELSRALEALEGEALGSSPGAPAAGAMSGGLDDRLAEQLGLSPDADPTAFAQQMAKLYNNLGLKMMERRKHEEALGLLRKAEALVDNGSAWAGRGEAKRQRMQAVTYNNLGCLFKRRNMPQLALQYLTKALALEESVQNRSSTHLNICASLSALRRTKEALSHAERAIILLQRHLWAHHLPFQEGLTSLVRQLAAPGASRHALASANVLAMAYHNAAVEHEKLGRLREALVSFTRAYLISSKCLGGKAQMTTALSRALKAFQQRQARHLPTGAAHAVRKAPSTLASSRSAAAAAQSKRGVSRSSGKATAAASKSSSSLSSKAVAGSTLATDKGRTTTGSSVAAPPVRAPSGSRLVNALQQQQQAQQAQQQQQQQQQAQA